MELPYPGCLAASLRKLSACFRGPCVRTVDRRAFPTHRVSHVSTFLPLVLSSKTHRLDLSFLGSTFSWVRSRPLSFSSIPSSFSFAPRFPFLSTRRSLLLVPRTASGESVCTSAAASGSTMCAACFGSSTFQLGLFVGVRIGPSPPFSKGTSFLSTLPFVSDGKGGTFPSGSGGRGGLDPKPLVDPVPEIPALGPGRVGNDPGLESPFEPGGTQGGTEGRWFVSLGFP
eukprot:scaffold2858_cov659-Pavlova_lutheri.AAC.32